MVVSTIFIFHPKIIQIENSKFYSRYLWDGLKPPDMGGIDGTFRIHLTGWAGRVGSPVDGDRGLSQ